MKGTGAHSCEEFNSMHGTLDTLRCQEVGASVGKGMHACNNSRNSESMRIMICMKKAHQLVTCKGQRNCR